jgi:hypothetical protein
VRGSRPLWQIVENGSLNEVSVFELMQNEDFQILLASDNHLGQGRRAQITCETHGAPHLSGLVESDGSLEAAGYADVLNQATLMTILR